MPLTLADLVHPTTETEARDAMLTLLKMGGFPTASWDTMSIPRRLIDVFAKLYADATLAISDIAKAGFLDYIPKTEAGYAWLTLVATNVYGITPKAPVFTRGGSGGRIVLTDGASAGPFTIQPRTLWIRTINDKLFTNVDGGTLPLGGTLGALTWEAQNPGASWNVPINTINQMVTPLPGVTVNNPGVSGEWITTYGADQESHDSVVIRCKARWPELGAGASALVWQGWALAGSVENVRARVFEDEPQDGSVRVVLASASGPVSGTAITDTRSYIEPRRPLGSKPSVESATPVDVPIVVRLVVQAAYAAGAAADALTRVTAHQNGLDIGGGVVHYLLSKDLMSGPGVTDLVWDTPLTNVAVGPTEIVRFQPSITVETA